MKITLKQDTTPSSDAIMRKACSCGRLAGPTGACADCRRKKTGVQTKLRVNRPGDRYELEADHIADQVMRMSKPRHVTPLQTMGVQRSAEGEAATADNESLALRYGEGQPLQAANRHFFESRLGHNLGQVRIHDNAAAHRTASRLNANAFTVGSDISFARGQYQPQAGEGRRLLAHELAHVLQQRQAPASLIQREDTPAKEPGPEEADKSSPKFLKRRDVVFALAPEAEFQAAAKLASSDAEYPTVNTPEEMAAALKTIGFPINTIYVFAHSTNTANIKFPGPGYVTPATLAAAIKDAVPSPFQPNTLDFRGCSVGMDPAAMEELRQAVKAQAVVGSTCFLAFMGLPFTVDGVHIKERKQLKKESVKITWDKKFRNHPNKLTSKACVLSTSEADYFAAGGYFVSVYANKELTTDFSETESICYKDLAVEKLSPKDALSAKPGASGACKTIRVDVSLPETEPAPATPPAAKTVEEAE